MATFDCPDCKNKVSDKAASCPKCGRVFTPEEIKKISSGQNTAAGCGCLLIILFAVAIWFFSSSGDNTETSTAPKPTEQATTAVKNYKGLGLTPTELCNGMNDFAKQVKVRGFQVYMPQKTESIAGAVNDVYRINHKGTENIITQVTTPKGSKNIIAVTMIAQPKTDNEAMGLIGYMGLLIKTVSPQLSGSERGKIIKKLMNNPAGGLNEEKSVLVEDVKYTFTSSEVVGIMFFAENKDDAN